MRRDLQDLTDVLLDLAGVLRVVAMQAEDTAAKLGSSPVPGRGAMPSVDRQTLSVHWKGRSCFLGHTTALRLMERLAQRPNQYLSHGQLLTDVWGGSRSPSASRSAVADLRSRLAASGMAELADAIDGRNPGHYGLIIHQSPSAH